MDVSLPHTDATKELGANIAKLIGKQAIITLNGPLGAGKTTLLQGLANSLGIKENIVSPTFVTMNEYPDGRIPFYHLDLYRIGDEGNSNIDFLQMELDEISSGNFVIAIEWSQYLNDYLQSKDLLAIDIKYENDGRKAFLTSFGKQSQEILDKLKSIYFC